MRRQWVGLVGVVVASLVGGCSASDAQIGTKESAIVSCYGYNSAWNSNEEAEVHEEVTALSDECDEIPVGLSKVGGSAFVVDGNAIAGKTDSLVTDGRNLDGAHNMHTVYRFCECEAARWDTPAERFDCAFGEDDCEISDLDDIDNEDLWHAMTLEVLGGGSIGSDSETDFLYNGPYERDGGVEVVGGSDVLYYPTFRHAIDLTWDVVADGEEWLVDEFPGLTPFDLPGVIWTHTPRITGQADFSLSVRRLANNYTSGSYGVVQNPPNPDTDTTLPIGPIPFPFPSCPHCPWMFPTPFLLIPPCFGSPTCGDPAEARFHGMVQNAASAFAGGPPSGLGSTSGTWTAVSEPDFIQGETGLRYAAVASNGTSVNALLTLSSNALTRTTPSNSGSPPASRSLFGVAASVLKNRIWVMGGINGGGGLYQNLYQYNVSSQTWSQVTINGSYKPSRVLAAAYAPGEDRLLVLDQVTSGGSVRLLRLDPNGSAASQLVGTWSRSASTTTFGLTPEPGNRSYLVACGGTSSHAVLRLKRNGTGVTIWANTTGSGSLASRAVQAGIHGISLLVNVSGVPRARGYETRNMSSGGSSSLCF